MKLTSLATRLASGASGLNGQFLASSLQLVNALLGPAGEVNVHRGAHTSAKVGGAGVDVAVAGIQSEVLAALSLDGVTDGLDTAGQALEDTLDVTALLHGDNSQLILLIDPQKEGLGIVVEDTSALGPVTLHTSDLQVAVTRHEEEVVIDQLLADTLVHASQGVVGTSKIASQLGESGVHQLLNVNSLLLGDAGGQTEAINVATNTDTGGVDGNIGVDVAVDLGGVHVGGVLGVSGDAMVLLDQRIEDNGEVLVGVPVTSIDTAMLVVELNGASAGLGKGETTGLGLNILEFVPLFLGDVLGHQGVGRLDSGELTGHNGPETEKQI